MIDQLPSVPGWHTKAITLPEAPDEPQALYYREANECVAFLFRNPSFKDDCEYDGARAFEGLGTDERVIHEMSTADMWNTKQVSEFLSSGENIGLEI